MRIWRFHLRCGVILAVAAASLLLASRLQCAGGPDGDASPRTQNLLRNTRLVAGLPSGWTISGQNTMPFSEGEDVIYQTDEKVTGPSGYPAFLVEVGLSGVPSSYGWQHFVFLYTEPFKVDHVDIYTASASLKGNGEGSLEVIGEKRATLASIPFVLNEGRGWTRISCSFQANPRDKLYGVRFRMKGQIWFDQFQVNRGNVAAAYASAFPAEVALATTGGELAVARIQFAKTPPTVEWVVTGAKEGDMLKGKVIDLNNESRSLPEVQLTGKNLEAGTWDYALPGLDKLGQFRIEAWVDGADGARQSSENELIVTRLRQPRYWGRMAPNSPFGIHIESSAKQTLAAKAFGMNWVRFNGAGVELTGWSFLEYAPDTWRFFDAQVDRFRKANLCILGQLGTAPPWRSHAKMSTSPPPKPFSSVTATFFEPLDLKEYEDYVRRVVSHYRDRIQYYDMWNEPWHPAFFSIDFVTKEPASRERSAERGKSGWYLNSDSAPEHFARLQEAAFQASKEVAPEIKIVGFGTHTREGKDGRFSGDEWTGRLKSAGGLKSLDAVGYHDYVTMPIGFPGDAIDEGLKLALGPLGGITGLHEAGHPVWMTEGSPIARKIRSAFYHHTLPYKDDENCWEASDRIVRYFTRLLAERVDKIFLYSMDTTTYFGEEPRPRMFVNEDGYPHPTSAAASNITWHLEDTAFRKAVEPQNEQFTAYVFDGAEESVVVLMPRPGMRVAVPKSKNLAVQDIFGNPAKTEATEYCILLRGPRDSVDSFLSTIDGALHP